MRQLNTEAEQFSKMVCSRWKPTTAASTTSILTHRTTCQPRQRSVIQGSGPHSCCVGHTRPRSAACIRAYALQVDVQRTAPTVVDSAL